MSQATAQQIAQLESAHKEQFRNLVLANNLVLNLYKDFDKMNDSTKQAFLSYYKKVEKLVQQWQNRQNKLENIADIPPFHPIWFNYAGQSELNDLLNSIDAEKQNKLGFIPLLIWGAIALVGAFTTAYVIDELSTTAQEKQELLTSTANFCQQLNLTNEQCAQLLNKSTDSGGIFSDILKPLLWIGIGYLVITNFDTIKKTFTKKTA